MVIFYKETNLKKTPSQRCPKNLRKALAAIVSGSVCAACIISYFHVRSDSLLDTGQSTKLIAFHICAYDSFLRNFRAFSSTSKRYGEKRFAIGKYQEISLISWQERRSVLLGRCTSVRSVEFIPCRKDEQFASLQYRLSFMSYSSLNVSSFHLDVTRDCARRTSRHNPSFKMIAFI